MTKWQYGLAVYQRKLRKAHHPIVEVESGVLPMPEFNAGDLLHLDIFLKRAGEHGWELASVMEPSPLERFCLRVKSTSESIGLKKPQTFSGLYSKGHIAKQGF